ncbi:MAG: hypothetical protein FWD31_13855 [Planctomycetaceae bacterium]|nr:hypothetical protein [Planctomycetaceae bacterium]
MNIENMPPDLRARLYEVTQMPDGTMTFKFTPERKNVFHTETKRHKEKTPCDSVTLCESEDTPEQPDHEIPSQLFDGLFFSESEKTIRYGDQVFRCRDFVWKLLMLLEDNDGTLDLGYAATECWGKPYEEDDVSEDDNDSVSYGTIKTTFYRLKKALETVGFSVEMNISQSKRQISIGE